MDYFYSFQLGRKIAGFHFQKYKKFFNFRVRKFHFPKYKEFYWGWILSVFGLGLKIVHQVALKYTTPAKQNFEEYLLVAAPVKCFLVTGA